MRLTYWIRTASSLLTATAFAASVCGQTPAVAPRPPEIAIVPLPPVEPPLFSIRQASNLAPIVEPSEPLPPTAALYQTASQIPKIVADADAYPVDLATSIHLAGSESLAIALAREQWREAGARARAAEVLWLPSIRAGLNYNKHEGVIQDVVGNAFPTSRGAFYSGLGAGAVGAGSPSQPGVVANFHLADALFLPLAARQVAASRNHTITVVTNDTLLEAALAYVELLARAQDFAVAAETRSDAERLAQLAGEFAQTGNGTQADADRARTELHTREVNLAQAREAYDVARARLAQVLRLDPTLKLAPQEEQVVPLNLVDRELPTTELVARGLSARPELAELRHLTSAAAERLRRERYAPLVPSLLVGTSFGGFGAGTGGTIAGYGSRFDFDAIAYWELRNLGAGERAARGIAQSQVNQTCIRQTAMMDLVAREIVEARARVDARHEQIESARTAVAAAEDSYRRNSDRIRAGEGLPLEALQAVQALAAARREYVRAVSEFNAAQFTLQRAMGWPVSGDR